MARLADLTKVSWLNLIFEEIMKFKSRDRRVGQEHFHQADEDHSRQWILGRREKKFHEIGLPEHFHGHEFDGESHGDSQDSIQRSRE